MKLSPENKEKLKTVVSCFNKAGVDTSTIHDAKSTQNNFEFTIHIKDKEAIINIDFSSGDVFYKYFTSSNKIGNVDAPEELVGVIKKGIEPKKIPNGVDENLMLRLKEALIKCLKRGKMTEMSTTGTGAGFNAGQGEQYATPFAFKKKKAIREATKLLASSGYIKVPDSLRHHAKSFDLIKWK